MAKQQCHFIGIGGIGMSGLARILLSRQMVVTGSDIASSYVTDGLIQAGAKVNIGHAAENVALQATVVYSTDIKLDNPEYKEAQRLNCKLLHRSDLLRQLMDGYKTLAVAGTHGKTTTSSLLAYTLVTGGVDPSYAVGGIIPQFQSNAGHGAGEYFVAEADESDGTFLKYNPYGAILTNIDFDHMDFYGSEAALMQAFQQFINKVEQPEHFFWCGDDARLKACNPPGISYGFGSDCQLRIVRSEQSNWHCTLDLEFRGKKYKDIQVALIGRHNILNASAVFGLALSIGVKEEAIRKAFAAFGGVKRRCEKKGEIQGVLFLDDYAHHPTEVETTLKGIRKAVGERRLIALFQPHRYTRTKECLGTYAGIFDAADEVIITNIFSAGEKPIPGVTHEQVIADVKRRCQIPCRYIPRQQMLAQLMQELRPHDVVVTLGAGDITKLGPEFVEKLKSEKLKKLRVGVVCGGYSVEHEISLISAAYVASGLRSLYYEVSHFGITKQGNWISGADTIDRLQTGVEEPSSRISPGVFQELLDCDILFPVLHGTFGEDGTIQGFFEMLGKAYVGCDHRSAAACMDKAMTKRLVQSEAIATAPFIECSRSQWQNDSEAIKQKVNTHLTFPLFVKPSHLGSSVGVSKVTTIQELNAAIGKALCVDTSLIIENGIDTPREIEFAVLGNEPVRVFPPGEICANGQVYDYEGKYGANGIKAVACSNLSEKLQKEGMRLAERAYRAAGCKGLARVDFFLDQRGKFWFNEINPMPGFTKISLYPQICATHGLGIEDLVDQLVIAGLRSKRLQQGVALKDEK